MKEMTPRERVRMALNHKEPDKVPLDLGGWQSGISYETYVPLKELLGINEETRMEERVQGLARVDEPVLEMFSIDTRYVFTSMGAGGGYNLKGEDSFKDSWGIEWKRPASSHYYDIVFSPFKAASIQDIDKHSWPNAQTFFNSDEIEKINYEIDRLSGSGYAIFTCLAGVFEQSTYLRGMTEFYMDIYDNPQIFEGIMDKVLEAELDIYGRYFEIVGEQLDVVQFWGDLGTQQGPLISPEHYRKYVKPREAALVDFAKKRTNARICLHSCGSVYDFIPDIIEAGYEVLNPVQTTAAGMDPVKLKNEFGSEMVFWGAIDTQRVLPLGTEEDVQSEVKRQIDALARGGGYILAPCHNIQVNTPPKNIVMLFNTANVYGKYRTKV